MIRPRRKKAWLVSVLFLCIGTVFVGCDDTSGAGSDRDPDMGGVTELCSADAPCARPNTFCDNGICQLQPCSGDNDCSAFVCPDSERQSVIHVDYVLAKPSVRVDVLSRNFAAYRMVNAERCLTAVLNSSVDSARPSELNSSTRETL